MARTATQLARDTPELWSPVWAEVATALSAHWRAGRGHLLTEDAMRLSAVVALEDAGVDPSRVTAGVPEPVLRHGMADLVVDGLSGVVVQLRHSAARTDSRAAAGPMGELLGDVMRLGCVPARRRWVVQVISARTMSHLASAADRHSLVWPSEVGRRLVVERGALEWLPAAAQRAVGRAPWQLPVVATCTDVLAVHGELALFALEVETPGAPPPGGDPELGEVGPRRPDEPSESPRGTARADILDAVRRILAASEQDTFGVDEVVADMSARGSRFAAATVRTMLTSHMCADVRGRGIAAFDDVQRVGPGTYRLRPGR
ncbi:hypothetical protein [Nocardioides sp. 616]|uniref:hypothetical protein n=1 Tax=Nocardioides sp. 616 TaxID=2268090 RepID=UPI000CE438B2|nr:hypothetical protein [Nocardioides sp. 616]